MSGFLYESDLEENFPTDTEKSFLSHQKLINQPDMSEVFVVFPPSTNNSIIYGRNSFSFCCKEIKLISPNDGNEKVSEFVSDDDDWRLRDSLSPIVFKWHEMF